MNDSVVYLPLTSSSELREDDDDSHETEEFRESPNGGNERDEEE